MEEYLLQTERLACLSLESQYAGTVRVHMTAQAVLYYKKNSHTTHLRRCGGVVRHVFHY